MFTLLWQIVVLPEIVPGCAAVVDTDTESVWVEDVPQVFPAETEMVPPELPTVAETVFVEEVPVHVAGNVQL